MIGVSLSVESRKLALSLFDCSVGSVQTEQFMKYVPDVTAPLLVLDYLLMVSS